MGAGGRELAGVHHLRVQLRQAELDARLALVFCLLGVHGPFHLLSTLFIAGGFWLQWPTLVTLVMFPVLVAMYAHLSRREEADMAAEFGDEYRRYAVRTPRFVLRWISRRQADR
jgi:protein-S-isoprenylcysteine O-methyltransferase Ste14